MAWSRRRSHTLLLRAALRSQLHARTALKSRAACARARRDGAPCNNRLDMFTETRTAALLQKVSQGADTLPAERALRLATIDGARALGLKSEIGSLEAGKRADITIVNLDCLHSSPRPSDIT